jgi:hypothetical protein
LLWLFLEIEVSRTTCLGWPATAILPISATQAARIPGMSHQHQAYSYMGTNSIMEVPHS